MTGWRDDEMVKAARAMTDVEPPADLEARITARLDASIAHRRRSFAERLAVPLAVAAAVAIVTLVVRNIDVPTSRGPEVPKFRSPEVPKFRGSEVAKSRSPEVPRFRRDAGATASPSEAELAWMARRIPALERIDALAVDRLSLDSIQPEPLAITPLSVTPLVVSPVNGDTESGRQEKD